MPSGSITVVHLAQSVLPFKAEIRSGEKSKTGKIKNKKWMLSRNKEADANKHAES